MFRFESRAIVDFPPFFNSGNLRFANALLLDAALKVPYPTPDNSANARECAIWLDW